MSHRLPMLSHSLSVAGGADVREGLVLAGVDCSLLMFSGSVLVAAAADEDDVAVLDVGMSALTGSPSTLRQSSKTSSS